MRILVDLNIVLDVLLNRSPHVEQASALWAKIETGDVEGILPAHGLTTLFYLAQKERNRAFARRMVERLLSVFEVAAVDESVIVGALALACPDFEDAVCAECARTTHCDFLVTRDPRGYKGAQVQVLDPLAALAVIEAVK